MSWRASSRGPGETKLTGAPVWSLRPSSLARTSHQLSQRGRRGAVPSGIFDLRGAESYLTVRRAPRSEKTPLGAVHRRLQQEAGEKCGLAPSMNHNQPPRPSITPTSRKVAAGPARRGFPRAGWAGGGGGKIEFEGVRSLGCSPPARQRRVALEVDGSDESLLSEETSAENAWPRARPADGGWPRSLLRRRGALRRHVRA